jgi:hypothetical protein
MLDGYMTGFAINAAVMIGSGVIGLLLLWPNSEKARLTRGAAVQASALKRAVSPT